MNNFCFRAMGTKSAIIFNQDLALLIGHILVLTMRDPTMYEDHIDPVCFN